MQAAEAVEEAEAFGGGEITVAETGGEDTLRGKHGALPCLSSGQGQANKVTSEAERRWDGRASRDRGRGSPHRGRAVGA